jgi:hypothetical protein
MSHFNAFAHPVDELIFFEAVLSPIPAESKLPLFPFLLWRGDGDKIGACAAGFNDLVGCTNLALGPSRS